MPGAPGGPSNRGLLIALGVVAGVIIVVAMGVAAVTLLGRTATPKYTQIDMSTGGPDSTYAGPQFDTGDSSDSGTSALDAPTSVILKACASQQPGDPSISIPPGFDPVGSKGSDPYAQVVRTAPRARYPVIAAAVNLHTGDVAKSPFEAQVVEMGRRSTVAICVHESTTQSPPLLFCASTRESSPGVPYSYMVTYSNLYVADAYSLADGKLLASAELAAQVTACPSGYSKVATPDIEAEAARLRAASQLVNSDHVAVPDGVFTDWALEKFGANN